MTTDAVGRRLQTMLAEAGFTDQRTEILDLTPAVVCVVAVSPSAP